MDIVEPSLRSPAMSPRRSESPSRTETLLALVVLGMLSAVAAPGHTAIGATESRGAHEQTTVELVASLAVVRNAVDALAADRDTTRAILVERGEELTPYLRRGRLPMNPLNGRRAVLVVDPLPPGPVGERFGWLVCGATGEVRANAVGAAPDGTRYYDL